MKQLVVATHNSGKQKEINRFLSELEIETLALEEAGITEDVEETGATFQENSLLKAKYYAQKSALPVIADDGGIEIYSLNNEPGVKSRRWIDGQTDSSDEALIGYALGRLYGQKNEERKACLRTVITLALPKGKYWQAEGRIEGLITEKPALERTKGYPYRSLLYLPQIEKYYNKEAMTKKEEVKYNHRRKALQKLIPIIKKEIL